MIKTAVVTGAGTGVGQATALALAREGWRVAIVGRRESTLKETVSHAGAEAKRLQVCPCDISDPASVERMAALVKAEVGDIEVLVNAAGTNTPARSLKELSLEKYRELVETNLTGAYLCVQAFLPRMRERRSGTIINVVSDAAKQASPKAGAAYVVSKFGMNGLTQSINAEERPNGIRACSVLPGDIDTPLLDKRPNPPTPEARQKMLRSEDVAECILLAIRLPARAVIEEILIRPA
ncbi:MAG: SDR family NAD(P)-dependent oxidoreductase [Verrucomicrobia subdivision 3 bacterium]|nr:SDR family NAD(P)-dependent oxidoreductase [Limisphaerales bacterium]